MTLDDEIVARINEAKEKNISSKAGNIARYLGLGGTTHANGVESTEYNYSGNGFEINSSIAIGHDCGGFGTSVKFAGNDVYRMGGGTIYTYVPGEWLSEFESLYTQSLAAGEIARADQKRKDDSKILNEELELRDRWGL